MKTSTYLHDGWTLRPVASPIPSHLQRSRVPATVPGTVHTDLLRAGAIPDPYLDQNEAAQRWTHDVEWRYERTLHAAPPDTDERVNLVFDGLDTIATVTLDGVELGRTANMHRSYRYDITDQLANAPELAVVFSPALAYARELENRLGARPHAFAHPYNMVRKMACSFGWDWGPDLQTAGMWRPVRLERWRTARFVTIRPVVDLDDDGVGHVQLHIEVDRAPSGRDASLRVQARLGSHQSVEVVLAPEQDQTVITMRLPDAPVWWPHGHGTQTLVDLDVRLLADELLDTEQRKIGFRRVELVTEPDVHGTSFMLSINGKPIEVKGANWIPDDHLITRLDSSRYRDRIMQARDANLNLLRVWGGGIYESNDFYDVCDSLGILVWQDFPLACAAYPEEEPLLGEIIAEVRDNVTRLMCHPSLAVFCGGNENLWSRVDFWGHYPDDQTWGERYYLEIFPSIVAELSPRTPYVAGSPYSPGAALDVIHPNHPDHGTMHIWDVWNSVDYTHYRDHVPRFCSEFGFQGPPAWTTLHRAVHDHDMSPSSPGVLAHQKADEGQEKMSRGFAPHLPNPRTFQDWHWTTQLNQARAISFAVEHFRSYWPRTTGSIVWQLNDCWPAISWSAIDYDGRLKPLWYALRSAYGPRLLTIQPRGEQWVLAVVNDTDEPWSGPVWLHRERFDGTVDWAHSVEVQLLARSTELIELPPQATTPTDARCEALSAELDSIRAWHFFGEDIDLSYDPAPLEISLETHSGGCRVIVTAKSLTRDLTVLADRLSPNAVADSGLLTIRAGERAIIDVRTDTPVAIEDVDVAAVVRCANDLVRSGTDTRTNLGHP